MAKAVENLRRQAIPILVNDPADVTVLKLFILQDRERVVMDDGVISQDITDKESAGHFTVTESVETPDTRFTIA